MRRLTLCRPEQYNTITAQLRDELGEALDAAEADRNVRVVLLDAEGPAFCAGYELAGATSAQARDASDGRVWDSAGDQHMIGAYAATWAKLHDSAKPTVAAVSGWCIAGGTNIVFNAHLIVAGESARFGYPPSRVWGVPEAPWTWVARMGMQRARRYMLTGDEFTAFEAKDMGVVLDVVPDDELATHAMALAQRIALGTDQPTRDDHLGAQRRGRPPVRPTLVPASRNPLRRHRPPHPGGHRLRHPGPRSRVPRGSPRTGPAVRRLRRAPASRSLTGT